MDELIRVGVDLGKSYFQVHALTGTAAINRKLSRTKVRTVFARLSPCRIGMEACG
jgi:transposase